MQKKNINNLPTCVVVGYNGETISFLPTLTYQNAGPSTISHSFIYIYIYIYIY